jgi:hypothetical protein
MLGPVWTVTLLFVLSLLSGIIGTCHEVQPFIEMDLLAFFPRIAWNHDPSALSPK